MAALAARRHQHGYPGTRLVLVWIAIIAGSISASSQEAPAIPYHATAAQLVALEQLEQLVREGEASEVVDLVMRTIDESQGRLVSIGQPDLSGGPARFVQWVPLRYYLQDRLLRWGASRPEILDDYRNRTDRIAREQFERVRATRKLDRARDLADEILATSFGDDALLLVADLAIEQGSPWPAIDALRRIDPRWQATSFGERAEEVAALGWESVLPRLQENSKRDLMSRFGFDDPWLRGWTLGSYVDSDLVQAEVGLRLLIAYQWTEQREASQWIAMCLREWFSDAKVWWQGRQVVLSDALNELDMVSAEESERTHSIHPSDHQWLTLGHDASRVYRTTALPTIDAVPAWRVEFPEIEVSETARPAAQPIGSADGPEIATDFARMYRSVPIVTDGIVIRQWGSELYANRIEDGRSWPEETIEGAFFEDTITDRLKPRTGVMKSVGQIWWTLSASQGRVAGRFGPPESGWLPNVKPERSLSRIELVDLRRSGRLVDRYPAIADSLQPFSTWELEGAPLIVDNRLYIGIARRDEATLTSALGCLDLASAQWLFVSPPIASARLLGHEQASRYGQSLVSYRDGVVYYQGDNGIVAAVDGESGKIRWSVQYRRSELTEGAYPHTSRASQRQATPVALIDGQAVVMAADQDGCFALDFASGRLLWASAPGVLGDTDQVLGIVDGRMLIGGDSLYWVDPVSGSIAASWPAGTSAQVHGSLPQPRRAGRGLLAGTEIYWPTEEAIWVFGGNLSGREIIGVPQAKRRLDLVPWGLRGGDLVAAEETLIIASGRTTVALRSNRDYNALPKRDSTVSANPGSDRPAVVNAEEISRKP